MSEHTQTRTYKGPWQFNRVVDNKYDEGVEMHNIDSVWVACRKALEAGHVFVVSPMPDD